MSRLASFLAVMIVALSLMPGTVGAQAADEGKGVSADAATKTSATAFITTFVERFNRRDPAAIDMEAPTLWTNGSRDETATHLQKAAPITLYRVGSVKTHATTGHVSVQVWYSGFWTPSTYWAERWYLQGVDGGYLIDHFETLTPRPPASSRRGAPSSRWQATVWRWTRPTFRASRSSSSR
jgi:hypothetical protein